MLAKRAFAVLGSADAAILPDQVEVQPDGSCRRTVREEISFAFQFEGAMFTARGRRAGDALAVTLSADLGPVPFSAESPALRRAIQTLVAANADSSDLQLVIDEGQSIQVEGCFEVAKSATVPALLTELTAALLAIRPRLKELAKLLSAPSLRVHDA